LEKVFMSLFCLVHGAFLGAWCWDLLIPELEARGHEAVAMDLPLEDPDAGAVRYAEEVLQALQGAGDDVVLVGHSMSGLFIPHRRQPACSKKACVPRSRHPEGGN
jgi:hypothetical protein